MLPLPALLLVVLCVDGLPETQKPHIIHILADDFGWANVGYHRAAGDRDIQTPNLDALAKHGIELDRFYVFQFCSPSRSAIQTGRNPIHVNVQNVGPETANPLDRDGGWQGIPVNMTGIATLMKKAGYRTHMVGKWDIGMATKAHHPRERGYETWLGYWHHSNDYWQHTVDRCGLKAMRDLWRFDSKHDGPAFDLANGPHCSQSNQHPVNETCLYEEELLTNRVKQIIRDHDVSQSLFLFWSMHLVHYPLQVPSNYLEKFAFIENTHRRHLHAMVNYMDEEVGEVVTLMKERGIWDNAVVVFHSDNGGEIIFDGMCGGNNWPLRGGKFSNFDGGVRVNAFVTGGVIPSSRHGLKLDGLATGWDWYATYAAIAGVDPTDHLAASSGLPPHDSLNLWPWLIGTQATSPRNEVVLGETTSLTPNGDGQTVVGGVIQGRYKLLVGAKARKWNTNGLTYRVSQDVLTGPSWPNRSISLRPMIFTRHCGRTVHDSCLFDIFHDPSETTSIAPKNESLFAAMLARVDALQKTVYSPIRGSHQKTACKVAQSTYENYWGPFADLTLGDPGAFVI